MLALYPGLLWGVRVRSIQGITFVPGRAGGDVRRGLPAADVHALLDLGGRA